MIIMTKAIRYIGDGNSQKIKRDNAAPQRVPPHSRCWFSPPPDPVGHKYRNKHSIRRKQNPTPMLRAREIPSGTIPPQQGQYKENRFQNQSRFETASRIEIQKCRHHRGGNFLQQQLGKKGIQRMQHRRDKGKKVAFCFAFSISKSFFSYMLSLLYRKEKKCVIDFAKNSKSRQKTCRLLKCSPSPTLWVRDGWKKHTKEEFRFTLLSYLCTRPLPSPPANFSTSETETRL